MPACGPSTTFVKASYINAASAFLLTQRLTPGASPYIGRALPAGLSSSLEEWRAEPALLPDRVSVRAVRFEMVVRGHLDFILRAQEHRHALVQAGRLQLHDALAAGGRRAARLLHDEGHRVGLVHQAQLAAL